MNARRKQKLLRDFLKLIENRKLNEKDYEELIQKLGTEVKKGDGAANKLNVELSKIYMNPNRRNSKIKAVGIVIEEFSAKVIAETITRITRGY